MNLTEQIIEKAIQYREMKIAGEVYCRAKFCLSDYCGVVSAGSKLNRKHSGEYLKNSDAGNYTVFNSGMTTDIFSAAFLNGWSAHITELDDGHRFGMIHPGSPIITPVLLVANKKIFPANIFCGVLFSDMKLPAGLPFFFSRNIRFAVIIRRELAE